MDFIPTLCIFCNTEKRDPYFYSKRWLYNRCKECDATARTASSEFKMWASAKQRAYEKHLLFDITVEDIVVPHSCPILGMVLNPRGTGRKDNVPSLDKIEPKLGYVKGNIAVISWRANRIKNDGTPEEHEKIAAWVREQTISSATT